MACNRCRCLCSNCNNLVRTTDIVTNETDNTMVLVLNKTSIADNEEVCIMSVQVLPDNTVRGMRIIVNIGSNYYNAIDKTGHFLRAGQIKSFGVYPMRFAADSNLLVYNGNRRLVRV